MKMKRWLLAPVLVLAGCAGPAEGPTAEVRPCPGPSVDSVRAGRLATAAYLRVDSAFPVRVLRMGREGCAWRVTVIPKATDVLGGGGIVRVDSLGVARVVILQQ